MDILKTKVIFTLKKALGDIQIHIDEHHKRLYEEL